MGHADYVRVEKPWGYELHWAKTDRYVGKILHVNAGHALSLQYHNRKEETILLWSGRLLFELGQGGELTGIEMKPGDRVHVTPKTVHRMTAIRRLRHFRGLDAGTRRRRAAGGSVPAGKTPTLKKEPGFRSWNLGLASQLAGPLLNPDPRSPNPDS